jgi:hypothetical protein
MRLPFTLLGAVGLLGGCGHHARANPQGPLPSRHVVEVLDTVLTRFPCIGDVRRWERRYRFDRIVDRKDPRMGAILQGTIEVQLWRAGPAGAFSVRPGRSIAPPEKADVFVIDDRPIYVARAFYDRATRTLRLNFCGPNFPA